MKKICDISNSEMILVFLQTELNSKRFSHHIHDQLMKDDTDISLLENPDLHSEEENLLREQLLANYRGYGLNKALFEDFPNNVEWIRATLTRKDLEKVKYMKYSYWNELSQNTRLPKMGAETIKLGTLVFNENNDGFIKAAEALRIGTTFPPMILISKDQQSDLVILEGHQRCTAYFLAPDLIPEELEVLIGYSPDMVNWGGY